MPDFVLDYKIDTMPLTQRFMRDAHPEYFDKRGNYRDSLRNEVNDERWRRINLKLDINREPS